MNSLGLTNRIDGTDLSLLIIAAFLLLLVGFVGFHCCKRKRSSGKKKALQRHIKKSSSQKLRESSELLKEAPQSFEEEVNGHLEDKKVTPSSSSKTSRNTKKASTHHPPSPDSSSPKTGNKNRNSGKQNKKGHIPKYQAILSLMCRKEADIESGQYPVHDLSGENLPTTSRMDKKGDNKKDAVNQSSTLKKDSITTKGKTQPDKQKQGSDIELSEIKYASIQKGPASSSAAKGAIVLEHQKPIFGNSDKDSGKKGNKRTCKIINAHSDCMGSSCKKCKPHAETSDENEKKEKPQQEKVGRYVSTSLIKTTSVQKPDTGDTPMRSSEDYVMIDADENTTGGTTITTSFILVHTKVEDKMKEKVTYSNLPSKNTPDLKTNQEFSYQEVKKTDPEPMDESDEEAQPVPSTGSSEYIDGAAKEVLPAKIPCGKIIESVGDVYNILEYASKEWKGETTKAEAIRKGYSEIPKQLGLYTIRVIRGDNYCAIRATLFQALVKKIPILAQFGNSRIQDIPRQLLSADFDWIMDWNFGARFHVAKNNVCEKMEECLRELSDLVSLNSMMAIEEGRVTHLLTSLNYKPDDYELKLMEAVKFLMLTSAIKLHKLMTCEEHVPIFATILFARDTSPDARQFMKKHLNAVGDTGGLEQIEMYLLGYTLGITIRVVRPSHFGKPDFVASYPDDMPVKTPMVTLVAEDDRHYNILS